MNDLFAAVTPQQQLYGAIGFAILAAIYGIGKAVFQLIHEALERERKAEAEEKGTPYMEKVRPKVKSIPFHIQLIAFVILIVVLLFISK